MTTHVEYKECYTFFNSYVVVAVILPKILCSRVTCFCVLIIYKLKIIDTFRFLTF